MQPLISIIAPVYNIPKEYLLKCFTSIINQTYKNWELIIVDDGSKDDSGKYCDEFVKKDNRIKVIHQENEGVSVARNKGLENSNGEYVAFIDSDDWIDENYLELFISRLNEIEFDICICNAKVERKNKSEFNDFFQNDTLVCSEQDKYQLQCQLICRGLTDYHPQYVNVGVPWGKLYKKSFLIYNKITFKKGIKRMEDNLFNLYAFKAATAISLINKRTYHYRDFSESTMHKYDPNIIEEFEPFLEELDKFVLGENDLKWIYGSNKRRITSINAYMQCYFFHEKNKENIFKQIKELKKYLSHEKIVKAVKGTNNEIMDVQSRIFYLFVKKRFALGLYILFKLKNIKR